MSLEKEQMKIKIFALALTLALLFSSCSQSPNRQAGESLYDAGLEVVSQMAALAGNSQFAKIYAASEDVEAVIDELGKGDFSAPAAVYRISISQTGIFELIGYSVGLTGLSQEIEDNISSRLGGVVISLINGAEGVDALAAASICSGRRVFAGPQDAESTLYIYTYQNAVPVAVCFTVGEGGAVLAEGSFVLNKSFKAATAQQVEEFFAGMQLNVKAETVA